MTFDCDCMVCQAYLLGWQQGRRDILLSLGRKAVEKRGTRVYESLAEAEAWSEALAKSVADLDD